MAEFGVLKSVDLREGWKREDINFTRWLAEPANLRKLGDEIRIPLEFVEREARVHQYRADIVARRQGTEEYVVIENQLETGNHDHLGKLLTYAAAKGMGGDGARTVIWISQKFTRPHRAAIDWLNRITDPGVSFFAVELQLWQIDNSLLAPRFTIICEPNNWQKRRTQETAVAAERANLFAAFWEEFISFCHHESTTLQLPPEAPTQRWLPMDIGTPHFHISLSFMKGNRGLECQLWIEGPNWQANLNTVLTQKDEIEATLKTQVLSKVLSTRAKIFESSTGDMSDRTKWPEMHRWFKSRGEAYVSVFSPLIKSLQLDVSD